MSPQPNEHDYSTRVCRCTRAVAHLAGILAARLQAGAHHVARDADLVLGVGGSARAVGHDGHLDVLHGGRHVRGVGTQHAPAGEHGGPPGQAARTRGGGQTDGAHPAVRAAQQVTDRPRQSGGTGEDVRD